MLVREKHYSLLDPFISEVVNMYPVAVYTTLYFLRNLMTGLLSKSVCYWQAFPEISFVHGQGQEHTSSGASEGASLGLSLALLKHIKLGFRCLPGTNRVL
jgi:hypothetical protein